MPEQNFSLLQQTLERDPDFAKLEPELKEKVLYTVWERKGLLNKILEDRDPEFNYLNPTEKQRVVNLLREDFVNYLTRKMTQQEALEEPFGGGPIESFIAGATGGASVAAKSAGKIGLTLAKEAIKRALIGGTISVISDIPTGIAVERVTKKIQEANLPTPVKVAANIAIPVAFGFGSAHFFSRLEKAAVNMSDKLALGKLRKALKETKTLESLKEAVEEEAAKGGEITQILENEQFKRLHKIIDDILKSKKVSKEFKEELLALPGYGAWEIVPPQWRRDLPVPSKAIPMHEDVTKINDIVREWRKQKFALPEGPTSKGEPLPEKTIIPMGQERWQKEIVKPEQPTEEVQKIKTISGLKRGEEKGITEEERQILLDRGFTENQINKLLPEEAQRLIVEGLHPEEVSVLPTGKVKVIEKIKTSEKVKQPWEMTKEEWGNLIIKQSNYARKLDEIESKIKRGYITVKAKRRASSKEIEHLKQQKIKELQNEYDRIFNKIKEFNQQYKNILEQGTLNHKFWVEKALKEGKEVPEEVLKDYPDLVEKYKQAAKEVWQMTPEEFFKFKYPKEAQKLDEYRKRLADAKKELEKIKETTLPTDSKRKRAVSKVYRIEKQVEKLEEIKNKALKEHEEIITDAMIERKDIPLEVLKEYGKEEYKKIRDFRKKVISDIKALVGDKGYIEINDENFKKLVEKYNFESVIKALHELKKVEGWEQGPNKYSGFDVFYDPKKHRLSDIVEKTHEEALRKIAQQKKEVWQMTPEEYAERSGLPFDKAYEEWKQKVIESEFEVMPHEASKEALEVLDEWNRQNAILLEPYQEEMLKEAKEPLYRQYKVVSEILQKYGINSQELNAFAGITGIQEVRSKFGLKAVKKDGLPLDEIGKRIREVAPDLLPEDYDLNDVLHLIETTPSKKEIDQMTNIIKMYAGLNPFEFLSQMDQIVSNALQRTVQIIDRNPKLKRIRQWFKSFYEPLPHLGEEAKERFYQAFYGTYRPKEAVGGLGAEELSKRIKKLLKDYSEDEQAAIEIIIRYLEDPNFRTVARQLDDFKEITQQLDTIVKHIDNFSEWLYQRGLITKSQREKWRGRYLTRLYNIDQQLKGIGSLGGITEQKIHKGRKIESIMDLAKKDREALGYIEDPALAVKMNIARNSHIIAADDFYRELIDNPEIVLQDFVMDNPFAKMFPNLPQKVSPKYMLEKILPWVEDELRDKLDDNLKKTIKKLREKAQKLQAILNDKTFQKNLDKDYIILQGEGVKYGILTGLPVHKDVALQVIGLWELSNIPQTALTKLDKIFSALYTWFKIAKVPFNLRAYPRNFISNIFQYGLSEGNPIPYLQEIPKTIKGIIEKDKYFDEALKMGLIGQNFAKKEIIDVLRSIQTKKTQKAIDLLARLSAPYGWIDDFAKLNTYRIMRKRGMDPVKAVRKAQEIHYDYGLVPFWVRQIRNPKLSSLTGFVGKLIMSPFVSFQSKAVQQFMKALSERPVTTSALIIGGLLAAKYQIEKYYEMKYGKKYKEGETLSPVYLRDPLIVHVMTKDGKHRYIDITQILPIGWLINAISKAVKDEPLSAAEEFGMGSSVFNILGELRAGKDFFTGRELYTILDTEKDKAKKGTIHALNKMLAPATIEQIQTWMRSKHPVFARWITGTNIYDYTPEQLKYMAAYNLRQMDAEFRRQLASLRNKYKYGFISEKEYREKVKELLKKRQTAIKSFLQMESLNGSEKAQ